MLAEKRIGAVAAPATAPAADRVAERPWRPASQRDRFQLALREESKALTIG